MNLRQISAHVSLTTPLPDADAIIDVLHSWIQHGVAPLEDQLLIDVVDYRHVPDGPGILLVAHEGFYSISEGGLRFSARRDVAGPAIDKITGAVTRLLAVAELLAQAATLDIGFDDTAIEVQVNDRLLAPSREALAEVTAEALTALLAKPMVARPDPRDPRGPATAVARLGS